MSLHILTIASPKADGATLHPSEFHALTEAANIVGVDAASLRDCATNSEAWGLVYDAAESKSARIEVEEFNPGNLECSNVALAHLGLAFARAARDCFETARSPGAADHLRNIMSSLEGAFRHVGLKADRATAKGE